ncbi:hypothetical protein NL676_008169 [Syzygium grande]|nr:hypothetical protein NL676_008169 [Syzygium grande]
MAGCRNAGGRLDMAIGGNPGILISAEALLNSVGFSWRTGKYAMREMNSTQWTRWGGQSDDRDDAVSLGQHSGKLEERHQVAHSGTGEKSYMRSCVVLNAKLGFSDDTRV